MTLVILAVLLWKLIKVQGDLKAAQQRVTQTEGQVQQRATRAVAASRGAYDGHVAEQAFPAAQHPYHPKDIFHFGGVVDYIVFDGLHDVRHAGRDPKTVSVVLVDVKWGSSRTSDAQKAVLSAVTEGRTRSETWHARATPTGELTYDRR